MKFLLSVVQALKVRGLFIAGNAGDDVGYGWVDGYMLNREEREIDRSVNRDLVFAGARCGCGGPLVSVGKPGVGHNLAPVNLSRDSRNFRGDVKK